MLAESVQREWVDTYELPAPLGRATLRLQQDAAIIRDGGPPCARSGEDAVGTGSGRHFHRSVVDVSSFVKEGLTVDSLVGRRGAAAAVKVRLPLKMVEGGCCRVCCRAFDWSKKWVQYEP